MSNQLIEFDYDGNRYGIPADSYGKDIVWIILRDKSIAIQLDGWFESNPPQPIFSPTIIPFPDSKSHPERATMATLITQEYVPSPAWKFPTDSEILTACKAVIIAYTRYDQVAQLNVPEVEHFKDKLWIAERELRRVLTGSCNAVVQHTPNDN